MGVGNLGVWDGWSLDCQCLYLGDGGGTELRKNRYNLSHLKLSRHPAKYQSNL